MRFGFSRNTLRRIGVSLTFVFFVALLGDDSLLKGQTNATAPNAVAPNRVPAGQAPSAASRSDGSLPVRSGAAVNTGVNPAPASNNGIVQTTGRTQQSQQLLPNNIPNVGVPGGSPQPRPADPPSNQPQRPEQVLPNSGQPFPQLTVQEAADLDHFLERWEKKSNQIGYFESKFQCWEKGQNALNPEQSTYGMVRYTAPNKWVFEVLGTVVDGKENQAPPEGRTKFLSTGDKIYDYDFATKQVRIYTIPLDQQEGIAGGGPIPFVFAAKAADMKKRYYLRIVTPKERAERGEIWLDAFPRTQEDAAEFKSIRLIFNEKELIPLGFVKFDVNEKDFTSYKFLVQTSMKIQNKDKLSAGMMKPLLDHFRPGDIPRDWTKEEIEAQQSSPQVAPTSVNPSQIQSASRQQPVSNTEETLLYTPPPSNRPQF